MRLTLGLFFLCAGTALLAARFVAPDRMAKAFDPLRMTLGALLALVLGGVNLAKWYAGRMAYEELTTPVRRPLRPEIVTRPGEVETNPEFDFKQPGPEPIQKPMDSRPHRSGAAD
ncbi:MAG TPA: hypothetical protein VGE74_01520 [Gemmata sp.]